VHDVSGGRYLIVSGTKADVWGESFDHTHTHTYTSMGDRITTTTITTYWGGIHLSFGRNTERKSSIRLRSDHFSGSTLVVVVEPSFSQPSLPPPSSPLATAAYTARPSRCRRIFWVRTNPIQVRLWHISVLKPSATPTTTIPSPLLVNSHASTKQPLFQCSFGVIVYRVEFIGKYIFFYFFIFLAWLFFSLIHHSTQALRRKLARANKISRRKQARSGSPSQIPIRPPSYLLFIKPLAVVFRLLQRVFDINLPIWISLFRPHSV